jgi:hypothetical protein
LKETGLEEEMKKQGVWDGWANGSHGRKD